MEAARQAWHWYIRPQVKVSSLAAQAFAATLSSLPRELFASSGRQPGDLLRTFANAGMVFSFAVAIPTASRSNSRSLAFAIFVGTTSLHRLLPAAFTAGLHAAFCALMAVTILAAVLSAVPGRPAPAPGPIRKESHLAVIP